MRKLLMAAFVVLTLCAVCRAGTNLNSSKSNIYRLIYPAGLISEEQVANLLADLDKLGPADQIRLKQWLPTNFRRFGVQVKDVKKIVVRPADAARKEITIILLSDPADEARALALSDEGISGPAKKP